MDEAWMGILHEVLQSILAGLALLWGSLVIQSQLKQLFFQNNSSEIKVLIQSFRALALLVMTWVFLF